MNEFLERLGHDGSEILWPDLQEPKCRRGFHIQECIKVASECGFSVTPMEFIPVRTPDFEHQESFSQVEFVISEMRKYSGIVTGTGRHSRLSHVVAWHPQKHYFDPAGLRYDHADAGNHFFSQCFWKMMAISEPETKIKSF